MKLKKTKMQKQKGFTIIELIVVVAIIAVLAGIVLVNVTTYINKGKNAAIKGNLSTIMTNAADYFYRNSSYSSFCTDALMTAPLAAADSASGGTAVKNCSSTAWCACSTMKVTSEEITGSTFCVDSTGYKKVTQNASGCSTRCPSGGACID